MKPQDFLIYPNTNRFVAEARLEHYIRFNPALSWAYFAVKRADQTGRLWGTPAMKLRDMSGYQFCKLVISYVGIQDMDEVARKMNSDLAA